ncbi:MAG TPA: sulfite exporter TauE/SafE family protein [Terriglobia bacterium]|nr:sulfite exporter TauE/SafE family protein [Terriglobia bacterium]
MFITLLGFITGTLIGLTGTGGGVILTPLLLIFTPFPAVVIIGTDIVNGAVTKLLGVIEHRKLGQVHWRLAGLLISGSVPGTLAGIVFVSFLKAHLSAGQFEHVLKTVLAITLFSVSIFLPFVRGGHIKLSQTSLDFSAAGRSFKLVAVGAAVGFMVAVTSIGSGSLLMIFLLLLVPLPLGALVGTDIAFGLATMALAGALHVGMGHFDAGLFLRLVAGALPGVVLGSRLTRLIPERYFSWLFSILYFSLGARLLVG